VLTELNDSDGTIRVGELMAGADPLLGLLAGFEIAGIGE
jgi:hypothetical protein